MKKLIFIVLMLTSHFAKAPPITQYNKDTRTHYYHLEQEELRKTKQLEQFLFHLSLRESSNNWKSINKFGYIGKYQFGNDALKDIGLNLITTKKFRKNKYIFPIYLQDIAVKKYMKFNSKILKKYMKYIGCTINGVYITKSGLLAAAHLGGAGNVIKFLNSDGDDNFADGNGTTISNYLQEFNKYKF